VTGLEFAASTLNSLAWPVAVVILVVLLRPQLARALDRMKMLEFPFGKASFDSLEVYKKVTAIAVKDAESAADQAIVAREVTEFSLVEALTSEAPGQAIIGAWGLLEYQLNAAADQIDPDKPRGWPQVARTMEAWDKWPVLYSAVRELRRLRDYTVRAPGEPSSDDAARYVSVAKDLATTVRAAFFTPSYERPGGAR
jgi:hypothetical protein